MDEREKFLAQVAADRERRNEEKRHTALALDLQHVIRGHLARKRFREGFIATFDRAYQTMMHPAADFPSNLIQLRYGYVLRVVYPTPCLERALRSAVWCRMAALSMGRPDKVANFSMLFLAPAYLARAKRLVDWTIAGIPALINHFDVEKVVDFQSAHALLSFLVAFTTPQSWSVASENPALLPVFKALCAKILVSLVDEERFARLAGFFRVVLTSCRRTNLSVTVVNAFNSVALGVLAPDPGKPLTDTALRLLILHVMTLPGYLQALNSESLNKYTTLQFFPKAISFLMANESVIAAMPPLGALYFLANLMTLSYNRVEGITAHLADWAQVIEALLSQIQKAACPATSKAKRQWHPIVGWTNEEAVTSSWMIEVVKKQLQLFWSKRVITCLFSAVEASPPPPVHHEQPAEAISAVERSKKKDLFKRFWKIVGLQTDGEWEHTIGPVSLMAVICQLYQNALITFENIQVDIVVGLSQDDKVLLQLWTFINKQTHRSSSSDKQGAANYLLFLLKTDPSATLPDFAPICLFAEIAFNLISILDEKEMYESGTPFSLAELRSIADFANVFCYKVVLWHSVDFKQPRAAFLYNNIYNLCMLLHNRDARRPFMTSPAAWHATDIRPPLLIGEFEKRADYAITIIDKMPHVIPLRDRLQLFRKLVNADRQQNSKTVSTTTVATIRRNAIVEDGFRQIGTLTPSEIKAGFRIKFINQQGLEEAGIDHHGIFKEFVNATVKAIFDPELNLFKQTSSGMLYPSHTSSIHPNHLDYFFYIGRILSMAVYNDIMTELHLAPVLLATILGKQLCAFDELAAIDPGLYKSLTYVKHYNESDDVADLHLTFSSDEEFLGEVTTMDLVPGGRSMQVTNENRILYIHTMAQYRVVKQTKRQTDRFVDGFRSILSPAWLSLFSAHELQQLVSGIADDIDIADLKKHVQYFGGFHANHRVIKWLWDVVEHEFSAEERHLFLRFVTSCSQAPLLGFGSLDPPFSIRCVENGEDQDQGDTLGSVVRGFLALKRSQKVARLPTASTCFNLLKLPNYDKKSVLQDKLRYAIHADAGFELS